MKIAIMGAGALGCYFGGRLASAGQDVAFVARGAHLQALRETGMKVESPLGDFAMEKVNATSDPAEIGPVDLVVFLVKLYDTEEAAEAMRPLLKPETAVVSFQNGIDAWQRIGALVGTERVIGGLALIPAHIAEPGLVRHTSPFAKLTFGEFDGTESDRCKALLEALQGAGVDAELADNIQVRIWEKLVMLSALSAITTLTRLPMGLIRQDPLCGDLFREAILRDPCRRQGDVSGPRRRRGRPAMGLCPVDAAGCPCVDARRSGAGQAAGAQRSERRRRSAWP